jgi:copper transport protein
MSGHASAASPQWLTRPAVFVHVMGVAFWVGALVPLAALLSSPGAEARATLARFSARIPFAVGALVLAGLALAVVQLETPSALWTTAYGWVLAIKLVLVAALLGLAALNRFRLTAPVERGDAVAAQGMRRAILAEILLAVAILGLVALWRFTPPPRSEAAAALLRSAVSLHLHDAETMANVTITPGRAGPVAIEIAAFDQKLQPLSPKEVTVVLTNPAAGIEPIRRVATRTGAGPWIAEATLPVPGEWHVRLDLLVTDFRKVTLEDVATIR